MIKGKKGPAISLREFQHEELERIKRDPVYFYNTYVRKEGQKVQTQEEYEEMLKMEEAKGKDLNYTVIPTE